MVGVINLKEFDGWVEFGLPLVEGKPRSSVLPKVGERLPAAQGIFGTMSVVKVAKLELRT